MPLLTRAEQVAIQSKRPSPLQRQVDILRLFLGAMWLVAGSEKFGVAWPPALTATVQPVIGHLTALARQLPHPTLPSAVEGYLLPLEPWLSWAVGALEGLLGLGFLFGVSLQWAALTGFFLQLVVWASASGLYSPLLHVLMLMAHLLVAAWREEEVLGNLAALARVALGAFWLLETQWVGLLALIPGVGLLLGLMTPWAAGAGLLMTGLILLNQLHTWPWAYYLLALLHLLMAAISAGRIWGLDGVMGNRQGLGRSRLPVR